MSNPGYPYSQGYQSHSSTHPHEPRPPNSGPPYPSNSAPYPNPGGVWAPSLGFNVGSPMYMPQPYAGTGYPSSTSGASYNPSYPQSSYPGGHSQPYPHNPAPTYPPSQQTSLYGTNQSHSSPYPNQGSAPPNPHPSHTQTSSYGVNQRHSSAYPNTGSSHTYANTHEQSRSSYGTSHSRSSPYSHQGSSHTYANNPGQSYPTPSLYPTAQSSYSHSYGHGGYTKLASAPKTPTVVPAFPFDPRSDAEKLRKAMKGFGTDEKAIIDILTKRSNAQRLEIAVQFKALYGKDLIKDLKGELSGNFERIVVALMTPLPQYYARELHDAISGLGTDETVLIEVLCSLTNAEIRVIREAYHKTYHKNLESDLKGDTSGHFKRLMVSLCSAGRDESMETNAAAAAADAQALYNAGEKIWGTDESTFNMVLCQRNHAQVRLVFEQYQKIAGHDIEKAIKSEFSGDIEDGLLAVIRSIKNQPAFYAQRLYKSMRGLGTNDRDLVRLVVTRCEVDMADIKREYALNHGETLGAAIKGDTSGDYKKCLLALIGEA